MANKIQIVAIEQNALVESINLNTKSYGKKIPDNPIQIKAAIELLKKNGYRVLKPTTKWEEV